MRMIETLAGRARQFLHAGVRFWGGHNGAVSWTIGYNPTAPYNLKVLKCLEIFLESSRSMEPSGRFKATRFCT